MSKKTWMISAVLVVIVGIFTGVLLTESALLDQLFVEAPTEQVVIEESPWQQEANNYTTEVTYQTPAGIEVNQITLTVENNTVTAFEMTIETTDRTSIAYQTDFIAEAQQAIVGKSVAELQSVDTIAGASLTTDAFRSAASQLAI